MFLAVLGTETTYKRSFFFLFFYFVQGKHLNRIIVTPRVFVQNENSSWEIINTDFRGSFKVQTGVSFTVTVLLAVFYMQGLHGLILMEV